MAELSRDDVLPCDVLVAPGTIIRAGCNVSTLLLCLGNRVGREIAKLGPRGEIQAPQAVSVPGFVLVPESALQWLNGEGDDFECPPSRYFRGKVPTYWWRSVFREMIAAAPQPTTKKG